MIWVLASATLIMAGYIIWAVVFRLRHDRVKSQRQRSRGKFAFRAKERARFLLGRSFPLSENKPEWEDPLVSKLVRDARDAEKSSIE